MPVKAELPPIPRHPAWDEMREQIEEAKREGTDKALFNALVQQSVDWRRNKKLFGDGQDEPAKKLGGPERQKLRGMREAEITPADIDELIAWFSAAQTALAGEMKSAKAVVKR